MEDDLDELEELLEEAGFEEVDITSAEQYGDRYKLTFWYDEEPEDY